MVAQQYSPGGFPLCLSGIRNSSKVQGSTRHQFLRLRQISFLGTEISLSPGNSMDSISANSRLFANDNQTSGTEGSERDETIQERPQLAVILEMEDHERRREAIRKQRSSRRLLSNYADEDRALMGGNRDRLHNLIEEVMGDPTFKQNFYSSIRHHVCAKAA
uniref:Uncharacterized protein n=1 Tax=Picea sitchensis TaxID=3332 RepID=A9NPN3_PICSI|nr:unknown [Picea sitchensis]